MKTETRCAKREERTHQCRPITHTRASRDEKCLTMYYREMLTSASLPRGQLDNNQLRRSEQTRPIADEVGNLDSLGSVGNRNEPVALTNTADNAPAGTGEPGNLKGDATRDFQVDESIARWLFPAIPGYNVRVETVNSSRNNDNNNLDKPGLRRDSTVDSLVDYEGRESSPEDSSQELTPSERSDWSEEGDLPIGCRGIVNPNYPGFQHLAPALLSNSNIVEDERDSCPDYDRSNEIDARSTGDSNEYNNNVEGSINHLCGQRADRKIFYEKPKFNIQTVTSLYESVVPPSEKCINYVKSVEVSRSGEKILSPEPDVVVSDVVQAETHLTLLEPEEGLADPVSEDEDGPLKATVEEKHEREATVEVEVPVDVEVVELVTSVNESLQFPEIEEIPDSGKTSEIGETDEITVEHIDLIREAKELPHSGRSKIGNQASVRPSIAADDSETNTDSESYGDDQPTYTKLEEIDLLSSIGRDIGVDLEKYAQPTPDVVAMESMVNAVTLRERSSRSPHIVKDNKLAEDTNKLLDRDLPESSSADFRKKEKMARNQAKRRQQQQQQMQQQSRPSNGQRRPDKRRADVEIGPGGFDVYNIETAMPKIDLDAIESHLRAAREEERRDDEKETSKTSEPADAQEPADPVTEQAEAKDHEREDLLARFDRLVRGDRNGTPQRRNDREEIRRRLAMGPDAEDLRAERGRKPSLQSRLQSGMNLQICFMNETPSDTESPGSEDVSPGSTPTSTGSKHQSKQQSKQQAPVRPQVLSLPPLRLDSGMNPPPVDEADFFARQARLQTEARMALAQAKEMAHMQMEVERQRLKQSPITEMVRSSLEKVGVQLGEDRRRLSRVLLTELNVAQLQVVANDLHARIATLNEALVEGLLRRDDLHMEQDSMLVDVEDLTRYLLPDASSVAETESRVRLRRGAKQESMKKKTRGRGYRA